MKLKEINQVLDAEIKFSETTPLAKQFPSEFVKGFVAGLKQARYLVNKAQDEIVVDGVSLVTGGCVLINSPSSGCPSYVVTYSRNTPQANPVAPIPDLDKILEKYDGIVITGQRGCGKTETGLKVLDYLANSYRRSRATIITPTAMDASYLGNKASNLLGIRFRSEYRRLEWPFGFTALLPSAERLDVLHGQQQGILWLEELTSPTLKILEQAAIGQRLSPNKIIITSSEPWKILENGWLKSKKFYTYYLNKPI